MTRAWLRQVIVELALICHSSYRDVVEFLRDLLGVLVSVSTVHDVLEAATRQTGRAVAVHASRLVSNDIRNRSFRM